MSFDEFLNSIQEPEPISILNLELKSLWYDKKGNWKESHELIQNETGKIAKRIHAYLHRKEGDLMNASYWYRDTNTSFPNISLDDEWKDLVKLFCK